MQVVRNANQSAVRVLKTVGLACLLFTVGAGKADDAKTLVNVRGARPQAAKVAMNVRKPAIKAPGELLRPAKLTAIANRPASIEQRRTVRMEVTAYCPCTKCCGPAAQGITASGERVSYNGGKFVAADTDVLPFGTRLLIPGYDAQTVEVIDRGGAIKGRKLDVFYPTHEQALEWGRKMVDVVVVE